MNDKRYMAMCGVFIRYGMSRKLWLVKPTTMDYLYSELHGSHPVVFSKHILRSVISEMTLNNEINMIVETQCAKCSTLNFLPMSASLMKDLDTGVVGCKFCGENLNKNSITTHFVAGPPDLHIVEMYDSQFEMKTKPTLLEKIKNLFGG